MVNSKSTLLLVVSISLGLLVCGGNDAEYNSCVEKGIQYYKDIGSYPNLTTENISAEAKVQQSCKNSVVAFD